MEAALLNWMIFVPTIGAAVCLLLPSGEQAKKTALGTAVVTLLINIYLAVQYYHADFSGVAFESEVLWIGGINAFYRTGVDGLSMPLVLLTSALSVLVVMASWKIEKATKAYLALYLFLMTGMYGVFLALDLFLFYVFFEVSLLPMYFLIGVWGGPRKEYAAIKFFLFTLAGSICLLIVMLGLFFLTPKIDAAQNKNVWTMASSRQALTLQSPQVRDFFARPSTVRIDLPEVGPIDWRPQNEQRIAEKIGADLLEGGAEDDLADALGAAFGRGAYRDELTGSTGDELRSATESHRDKIIVVEEGIAARRQSATSVYERIKKDAGSDEQMLKQAGAEHRQELSDLAQEELVTRQEKTDDFHNEIIAIVRNAFSEGNRPWLFCIWAFWLTFIAFAIKVPVAPFHTWLPDAHVEAPTPISMILAGVLLKMGGYALMRITYPFFPDAAVSCWVVVSLIGVFSIIYGALCSLAQSDWKKLVAYSSVSHMGYVILGLGVLTRTGFDGAYFQMIAHGITSAMMFFLVGVAYERAHHREIDRFGGLWLKWPGYGGWSLLGFFAGMGLPGLCGFIGEIMVLLGTFQAAAPGMVGEFQPGTVYTFGIIAASGVVLTAGYILWMFQRVYMGTQRPEYEDYQAIQPREYVIMGTLGVAAIVFGVLPVLIFRMTTPTFEQLMKLFQTGVTATFGG